METSQVSRSQFITWIISVSVFLVGGIATMYLVLDSRIRALELESQVLKTKYEQHGEFIREIKSDIKDIKEAIHNIDIKITPISKK